MVLSWNRNEVSFSCLENWQFCQRLYMPKTSSGTGAYSGADGDDFMMIMVAMVTTMMMNDDDNYDMVLILTWINDSTGKCCGASWQLLSPVWKLQFKIICMPISLCAKLIFVANLCVTAKLHPIR